MKIILEKGKAKHYEKEKHRNTWPNWVIMKNSVAIVWSQPDICGISEKYSRCNKRENIGTLGWVGHKVSNNEQTLQPSHRVRHLESNQMSAVYWRNIWVVTPTVVSVIVPGGDNHTSWRSWGLCDFIWVTRLGTITVTLRQLSNWLVQYFLCNHG